MEFKKLLKINYKLGRNFLLIPSSEGWVLSRCGSYRVIMDSNRNTEEELDKFVKEHREYNVLAVVRKYTLITNTIILAICISNLFIHSQLISFFCVGAIMILLPLLILIGYVGANNHDIYQKVLDEDIAYYGKILSDNNKEIEKKIKVKSTRSKKEKKPSEIQK